METLEIIQEMGEYRVRLQDAGRLALSGKSLVVRCEDGSSYHYDREGLCIYENKTERREFKHDLQAGDNIH